MSDEIRSDRALTSPGAPTIDLESVMAQVRQATDRRTVVVPQHAYAEALRLLEGEANIRVVCSSVVPPGHAYVINDSEIERIMQEWRSRPLTITHLPDADDEVFRFRAEYAR